MATPKQCREEVHQILTAQLAGNGIEAADIYRFRTARFRDDAPTHAWVSTHRLAAEPLTQSEQLPFYLFRIFLAARYNDQASELAAEDEIDNLEIIVVSALANSEASDVWESLDFLPGPERTSMEIMGKFYRVAQQIIKVEINHV